jgi:hypothetical protein
MGGVVFVVRLLVQLAFITGAGAPRVETVTLDDGARDCRYGVTLPQTHQPRIDAEPAAWAKRRAAPWDPVEAVPANQAITRRITTTRGRTVVRNDGLIFAVSSEETQPAGSSPTSLTKTISNRYARIEVPGNFEQGPAESDLISANHRLSEELDEGISITAGPIASTGAKRLEAWVETAKRVNQAQIEGYAISSVRHANCAGERAIEIRGKTAPRRHPYIFRSCYIFKAGVAYEMTWFHPVSLGNEAALDRILEGANLLPARLAH